MSCNKRSRTLVHMEAATAKHPNIAPRPLVHDNSMCQRQHRSTLSSRPPPRPLLGNAQPHCSCAVGFAQVSSTLIASLVPLCHNGEHLDESMVAHRHPHRRSDTTVHPPRLWPRSRHYHSPLARYRHSRVCPPRSRDHLSQFRLCWWTATCRARWYMVGSTVHVPPVAKRPRPPGHLSTERYASAQSCSLPR